MLTANQKSILDQSERAQLDRPLAVVYKGHYISMCHIGTRNDYYYVSVAKVGNDNSFWSTAKASYDKGLELAKKFIDGQTSKGSLIEKIYRHEQTIARFAS